MKAHNQLYLLNNSFDLWRNLRSSAQSVAFRDLMSLDCDMITDLLGLIPHEISIEAIVILRFSGGEHSESLMPVMINDKPDTTPMVVA